MAAAGGRVPGRGAGAGLCRRSNGAVPVCGDDARHQCRGASHRIHPISAYRRRGGFRRGAGDRARDLVQEPGRARRRDARALSPGLQQHQGAGQCALHGACLCV